MRTQTNEVQAIYNGTARQQDTGKIVVEVMTKEDHAAMHEMARLDIKKIAQAVNMIPKSVCIVARSGNKVARQQQETGLEQLNEMLRAIRETGDKVEAIKWGMVAAGYANGMCCGDLISKSELHEVIGLIDQTFKKTELRIEAAKRPFWARFIRKWVRA